MSFLARIAARALADPAQPVLTPKDRGVRRASPPAPEAQDAELAPIRASRAPALRRAAASIERDEEEVAAPLHRSQMMPDEGAQPARAAGPEIGEEKPEDEVAAPLRLSRMMPQDDPQAARAAIPAIREENLDEEVAAPLRRSQMMPQEDSQAARAAAPAISEESLEDEVAAPLRRAAQSPEDAAPIVPRAPTAEKIGEPEVQTRGAVLRRMDAPMEDEDAVLPLRRVADVGHYEVAAVRISKGGAPHELSPKTSLPLHEQGGEAAPPNPQALRSIEASAIAAQHAKTGGGMMSADASHESPAADGFLVPTETLAFEPEPFPPPYDGPETAEFSANFPAATPAMRPAERPKIVIDRVDVLIQEPARPARDTATRDIARSLRARYLGRL